MVTFKTSLEYYDSHPPGSLNMCLVPEYERRKNTLKDLVFSFFFFSFFFFFDMKQVEFDSRTHTILPIILPV